MTEDRIRKRRRAVSTAEIVEFLEYLAPADLAVPAAPQGLQAGAASAPVRGVVVAPLPTYTAISCAAAYRASLLITAAPLLTAPIQSLRWDEPAGAMLAHLARRQISLYVLAQSYAAAPGGFDDSLAAGLGLAGTRVLAPTAAEAQLKLVVFVPEASVARVHRAAAEAGAGLIGAYSHCSFRTRGTGTFVASQQARPAVGQAGRLEQVEELRLEMVVPERELAGVVAAVIEAHPYEEVAYDIYPLRNPGLVYGRGRIGELPLKVSLDTVLAQVNDALNLPPERSARCSRKADGPIGSLAVVSGVVELDNLVTTAQRQGAGALIAGGVSLNDLMLADGQPMVVIEVGFASSVRPGLERLVAQLRDTFGPDGVEVTYAA